MTLRAVLCVLALAWAAPAQAQDLTLPANAQLRLEDLAEEASYEMPVGPWTQQGFARDRLEGAVLRRVWQVRAYGGTTAQLIAPLRAQLESAGYEVIYACAAQECGGFDFRFGTNIAPAPAMHVNLADYAYLAARRNSPDGPGHVSVIVSRGGGNGYIHMVSIGPESAMPEVTQEAATPLDTRGPAQGSGSLIETLLETGAATLDDLEFNTGASSLSGNDYVSLDALAGFLKENPARRIVLVGHTDAEGSLVSNIALSRARATAVRTYLITERSVPAAQIEADGVGYLAPRASNSNDSGRERNRRVEAVLTSIE